jgi:hypothetical protein
MTPIRPVAARASRSAAWTASLPVLPNMHNSALGTVRTTASASSASMRWEAPYPMPVRSWRSTADITGSGEWPRSIGPNASV